MGSAKLETLERGASGLRRLRLSSLVRRGLRRTIGQVGWVRECQGGEISQFLSLSVRPGQSASCQRGLGVLL